MTDTHDGSHTLNKYINRKKSLAKEEIKEFINDSEWMGGRAVESTGLENRQGGNPFVGSNPIPSANCSFGTTTNKRIN